MKKNNYQKGFTLIELLVVIVVLIATGTVIGSVLFSSLRGVNKTNVITVVRQNGDYAISQMAKTIRNAKKFEGVSLDDQAYVTDCSQTSYVHYIYIKMTTPEDKQVTFSCSHRDISSRVCNPQDDCNSISFSSLIDANFVSTDENSCYFTCGQDNLTDAPTVGINFSLSQKGSRENMFVEKTATVKFQTSVSMRNLLR